MMNPIEQLALAALQRASEVALPESEQKSPRSDDNSGDDNMEVTKDRVALRKERNRQSAASSRKRAKLRTEELEEENTKLKVENDRLRRLLSGYLQEAVPDQSLETGFSSHVVQGADDSGELGATTSSSPHRTPSVSDAETTRVLLPSPRGNVDGCAVGFKSLTAVIDASV